MAEWEIKGGVGGVEASGNAPDSAGCMSAMASALFNSTFSTLERKNNQLIDRELNARNWINTCSVVLSAWGVSGPGFDWLTDD